MKICTGLDVDINTIILNQEESGYEAANKSPFLSFPGCRQLGTHNKPNQRYKAVKFYLLIKLSGEWGHVPLGTQNFAPSTEWQKK